MRLGRGHSAAVRWRRARRKVRQREKRHIRCGGQRRWFLARRRPDGEFARIFAPEVIDLHHFVMRTATLHFCKSVRDTYLFKRQNVLLDFSRTRKVMAAGMLVTVAEIDRAQRMGQSHQAMRCRLPLGEDEEGRIVQQVLDQIGLLERLDHPQIHADKSGFHDTVRQWRYATGTRIDSRPGDVLYEYEGQLAPALIEKMNIGLSEAVINSLHHAYARVRADGCGTFKERRWWMFTAEDSEGMLHVLICDLGIGIAKSLCLPGRWDRALLKKFEGVFSGDCADVRAIKTALVIGESSTGEEHRGKGLPQIWNAVHENEVGGVAIFSGQGHVSRDMETGKPSSGFYRSDLLGTLISWRVPIVAAGSDSDG